MPIRPQHRHFYPIDWPQLSAVIRFGRAGGRCETCGRPHGQVIVCLDEGTWYDAETGHWRSGRGRPLRRLPGLEALSRARLTVPILAACHRAHDTSLNGDRDLAAWCQRCHLIHDRPEHLRRRRITYLRRRALGDLFLGPYRCRRKATLGGYCGSSRIEGGHYRAERRDQIDVEAPGHRDTEAGHPGLASRACAMWP